MKDKKRDIWRLCNQLARLFIFKNIFSLNIIPSDFIKRKSITKILHIHADCCMICLFMQTSQDICNVTCRGKIRYIIHKKIHNYIHKLYFLSYIFSVYPSQSTYQILQPHNHTYLPDLYKDRNPPYYIDSISQNQCFFIFG